ncbi:hypothetical protein F4604DRAFT_1731473 [Suillus subluteus]|nr:hypothetical protein F4604DRAFT_1731473 [Suillus subluteus]
MFFDGSLWEEYYYREYERSFRCEVEAYRRLGHLQGSTIPRLYGLGRVVSGHGKGRAISPKVLFMEYIQGENLATTQDPHSVPSSAYQELVQKTLSYLAVTLDEWCSSTLGCVNFVILMSLTRPGKRLSGSKGMRGSSGAI